MVEIYDADSFDDTLDDSNSTTLQVLTDDAGVDWVGILLDDGSQDGQPAQYTITHRVRADQLRENTPSFMFYAEKTGRTDRSWAITPIPPEWQVVITNTSGNNNQSYRILLFSLKFDV